MHLASVAKHGFTRKLHGQKLRDLKKHDCNVEPIHLKNRRVIAVAFDDNLSMCREIKKTHNWELRLTHANQNTWVRCGGEHRRFWKFNKRKRTIEKEHQTETVLCESSEKEWNVLTHTAIDDPDLDSLRESGIFI